jgi:hypothetical protein
LELTEVLSVVVVVVLEPWQELKWYGMARVETVKLMCILMVWTKCTARGVTETIKFDSKL